MDALGPQEMISALMKEFAEERYLLAIVGRSRICVSLRIGATDQDELKAFVHAMTVQKCLKKRALKHDDNHSETISRYVNISKGVCCRRACH
jgi:hypothetical protein